MDDADAIRSLIHSYAELLDAGDLDGVATLFEHATWRTAARAEVLRGSEQVRQAYRGVILYDGVPHTRHVISNVTIVCDETLPEISPGRSVHPPPPGGRGRPVATARSYFTVLQARPDFDLQPILAGRYHDELEKADGEWRFTDRLILPDLVGDLSHHLRTPGAARELTVRFGVDVLVTAYRHPLRHRDDGGLGGSARRWSTDAPCPAGASGPGRPEYGYVPPVPRTGEGRSRFTGTVDELRDDVRAYEQAGVEHLTRRFWTSASELTEDGLVEHSPSSRTEVIARAHDA